MYCRVGCIAIEHLVYPPMGVRPSHALYHALTRLSSPSNFCGKHLVFLAYCIWANCASKLGHNRIWAWYPISKNDYLISPQVLVAPISACLRKCLPVFSLLVSYTKAQVLLETES